MEESDLVLPEVFYTLLDQRTKATAITPTLLAEYCELMKNDPTFLPELLAVIGPDKLIELIQTYGGVPLDIPTPNDILSTVRKSNES